MPTYSMNVFLLLVDLCRKIENIMNGYWWKGKAGKGILWKDWASLCVPKTAGGLCFKRLRDFNLAMLSKQAWKIFTNLESLVGRVFKARYFPKGDFLKAKLANSPSFIWRSLIHTQNIIGEGYYWRVGDGHSINIIWEELWLLDRGNSRVITEKLEGLDHILVANLFVTNQREWDLDVVADIFGARDAAIIRGIPE
ncbi:unnamed protein product [Cuscuta europaea]|uniref:Uncharacterized protein n=1 Tax=Cuscuta europaea TaxID=41803 RepID=A0A9P1A055_CUSEU|nr:unnamed protein product [Cuscuta europaea]